jgi:60S ribosome subunit biogenesis protein NIP7
MASKVRQVQSEQYLFMSTQAQCTYRALQVWIKPNGEMPYLYGNHVVKAHLGRITEDTPEHQGVVIFSMNDTPLGFGVTAKSSVDSRKLDPTGILVYNQAYGHPCTYTD